MGNKPKWEPKENVDVCTCGVIKQNVQDYCEGTTIHGIKYLAQKNRPVGERLWWLVVLILCFIGNAYLIEKVWKKWNESPVIVSFAEKSTLIWQIPFPAITICSEQKSKATVFNFTAAIHSNNSNEETMRKVGDISLLCDPLIFVNGSLTTDYSTIDFLIQVTPSLEELEEICLWKSVKAENCSELFSQVITEDGICYSFNMLSPKELFRGNGIPYYKDHEKNTHGWSLEHGYPPNAPLETYPQRAIGAGAKAGMSVVMKARKRDEDYYCKGPSQGFKILLHNPAEVPAIGERYLRAPLTEESIIVVRPVIMTTSFKLESYSPQVRQCYFPSERYLAHFKIYTQRNCELECLTNFTLRACGCVAMHMPRDQKTKICGPGSKPCMVQASEDLRNIIIESTFQQQTKDQCDCLPACTSIQYEAESSQADFNARKVYISQKLNLSEISGMDMARFTIYFKDMQFLASKRHELFGLVDFFANFGGLLGLFCGISLLSLAEIFYYFTIRLWSNLFLMKRRFTRVTQLGSKEASEDNRT